MDTFSALILGLVQGITEFLPISSTGHLVLARTFFGIEDTHALAFDAMLHLATACAVIVYFWRDIWLLVQTFFRHASRLPVGNRDLALFYALVAGTIPAAAAGLFLEDLMEQAFRTPLLVALVLVIGSGLFAFAEYRYRRAPRIRDITVRTGILVGFFQALALIPGMSRSGASIAGGMLLGLSRSDATRFAFLLAVPVIVGAGGKKFLELLSSDERVLWSAVLAGAATAFVVGLMAIHFMTRFLATRTLWPFIWYRIFIALAVVIAVFAA